MPGSIKIDDGSGNYTILTNGGSLGSDKTITIPNETATLATTNGITEIDTWALTATVNSNGDITSNLAIKNNLFKLIDLAFISRRKNIKNNLKSLNVDWSKMNIDPSKRPEELSLSQFISLAKEYSA